MNRHGAQPEPTGGAGYPAADAPQGAAKAVIAL